jgi:hypothetical protein
MILEGRDWQDLPPWMRSKAGAEARTWRQFSWALFSGELLMAWWHSSRGGRRGEGLEAGVEPPGAPHSRAAARERKKAA